MGDDDIALTFPLMKEQEFKEQNKKAKGRGQICLSIGSPKA